MSDADVCCGFGGTFAIKYRRDFQRHRRQKDRKHVEAAGADLLLAGDLGCLMNMAGKLCRQGKRWKCATSPRCWPA